MRCNKREADIAEEPEIDKSDTFTAPIVLKLKPAWCETRRKTVDRGTKPRNLFEFESEATF